MYGITVGCFAERTFLLSLLRNMGTLCLVARENNRLSLPGAEKIFGGRSLSLYQHRVDALCTGVGIFLENEGERRSLGCTSNK